MDVDELVIRKAAKGDENAFRQIVDTYRNYIYSITYNILLQHDEAENISQEVFIQAYYSLQSFKAGNFKGWLGRIAVNKAIDWKRKTGNARKNVLYLDEVSYLPANNENTIEEKLFLAEDYNLLIRIINEIPEKYARMLKNHYFKRKGYKQIALEENISEKTVESRLYRARKLIREKWDMEE